jgi:glutathione S-transferase
MVTLFEIPLSPYAQKIKLMLLEKGVEFAVRLVDIDAPDADFESASPRLEVPVLIDAEAKLFDSAVIAEYIEERWPTPRLLPDAPAERARVRMLQELCDTAYDAINWGIAEVTAFGRAKGELGAQLLAKAREQTVGINARLERELEARPWLNGESFGFGDIVAYPHVNSAAAQGNKPAPGSRLEAWLKTMRGRPSAARVKQDIVATLAAFAKRPQDVAEGRHRRQYRDHRLDWMMRSGGHEIVLQGMQAENIRFSYEIA